MTIETDILNFVQVIEPKGQLLIFKLKKELPADAQDTITRSLARFLDPRGFDFILLPPVFESIVVQKEEGDEEQTL